MSSSSTTSRVSFVSLLNSCKQSAAAKVAPAHSDDVLVPEQPDAKKNDTGDGSDHDDDDDDEFVEEDKSTSDTEGDGDGSGDRREYDSTEYVEKPQPQEESVLARLDGMIVNVVMESVESCSRAGRAEFALWVDHNAKLQRPEITPETDLGLQLTPSYQHDVASNVYARYMFMMCVRTTIDVTHMGSRETSLVAAPTSRRGAKDDDDEEKERTAASNKRTETLVTVPTTIRTLFLRALRAVYECVCPTEGDGAGSAEKQFAQRLIRALHSRAYIQPETKRYQLLKTKRPDVDPSEFKHPTDSAQVSFLQFQTRFMYYALRFGLLKFENYIHSYARIRLKNHASSPILTHTEALTLILLRLARHEDMPQFELVCDGDVSVLRQLLLQARRRWCHSAAFLVTETLANMYSLPCTDVLSREVRTYLSDDQNLLLSTHSDLLYKRIKARKRTDNPTGVVAYRAPTFDAVPLRYRAELLWRCLPVCSIADIYDKNRDGPVIIGVQDKDNKKGVAPKRPNTTGLDSILPLIHAVCDARVAIDLDGRQHTVYHRSDDVKKKDVVVCPTDEQKEAADFRVSDTRSLAHAACEYHGLDFNNEPPFSKLKSAAELVVIAAQSKSTVVVLGAQPLSLYETVAEIYATWRSKHKLFDQVVKYERVRRIDQQRADYPKLWARKTAAQGAWVYTSYEYFFNLMTDRADDTEVVANGWRSVVPAAVTKKIDDSRQGKATIAKRVGSVINKLNRVAEKYKYTFAQITGAFKALFVCYDNFEHDWDGLLRLGLSTGMGQFHGGAHKKVAECMRKCCWYPVPSGTPNHSTTRLTQAADSEWQGQLLARFCCAVYHISLASEDVDHFPFPDRMTIAIMRVLIGLPDSPFVIMSRQLPRDVSKDIGLNTAAVALLSGRWNSKKQRVIPHAPSNKTFDAMCASALKAVVRDLYLSVSDSASASASVPRQDFRIALKNSTYPSSIDVLPMYYRHNPNIRWYRCTFSWKGDFEAVHAAFTKLCTSNESTYAKAPQLAASSFMADLMDHLRLHECTREFNASECVFCIIRNAINAHDSQSKAVAIASSIKQALICACLLVVRTMSRTAALVAEDMHEAHPEEQAMLASAFSARKSTKRKSPDAHLLVSVLSHALLNPTADDAYDFLIGLVPGELWPFAHAACLQALNRNNESLTLAKGPDRDAVLLATREVSRVLSANNCSACDLRVPINKQTIHGVVTRWESLFLEANHERERTRRRYNL